MNEIVSDFHIQGDEITKHNQEWFITVYGDSDEDPEEESIVAQWIMPASTMKAMERAVEDLIDQMRVPVSDWTATEIE